jgi:toxin ParE1/3/4
MKVRRLPQAVRDVDAIWDMIAADDPLAATRLIERIGGRTAMLADHPESGRARPEIGDGIRSLTSGKYLILYRIGPDSVDIVRVIHGARDFLGLLVTGLTPENRHEEIDWGPSDGKEIP